MRRIMQQWACSIREASDVTALPIMTYPGLALTGKGILDAVNNPCDQAAIVAQLAARYPAAAAAVTMMDLSLEAEAFGVQVAYSDKEVPTVLGRLVADLDRKDPRLVFRHRGSRLRAIPRGLRGAREGQPPAERDAGIPRGG